MRSGATTEKEPAESDQETPNEDWTQWHCRAYDSRSGKHFKGECFVRASDANQAKKIAKVCFSFIAIRGRLRITAVKYYPWHDSRFSSYIGLAK